MLFDSRNIETHKRNNKELTGLNTVSSWQQIHYNQFFHSHPVKHGKDMLQSL